LFSWGRNIGFWFSIVGLTKQPFEYVCFTIQPNPRAKARNFFKETGWQSPDIQNSDETTLQSLGGERPRRGRGRLASQPGSQVVAEGKLAEVGRRSENEADASRDELKPGVEGGKIGLFLGLPSLGNGLAKAARVSAVKGTIQCLDEGP
jgi:hypothetical protein